MLISVIFYKSFANITPKKPRGGGGSHKSTTGDTLGLGSLGYCQIFLKILFQIYKHLSQSSREVQCTALVLNLSYIHFNQVSNI